MLDEQGYTFFNEPGEVYSFDIRLEGPTETNECTSGSVDPEVEMTVLMMPGLNLRQTDVMPEHFEPFGIACSQMRKAGSSLMAFAYDLCPAFDFILVAPRQADVFQKILPALFVKGAVFFQRMRPFLFGCQ